MFSASVKMKAIGVSCIALIVIMSLIIAGCGGCGRERRTVVHSTPRERTEVQAVSKFDPSDGFDLSVMMDLVKKVRDPKHLEAILNSESGPNNMDLNGDGVRDYAAVEMYGSPPEMGYSVYVYPTDDQNDRVEVCDLQLTVLENNRVDVYVGGRGYWANHTYWGVHPVMYSPLFAVALWHRPLYITPWGAVMGYRLHPYYAVTPAIYRSRVNVYTRARPVTQTTITKRTVKRTVRSPNRTTTQQFNRKKSQLSKAQQANQSKRATSLKAVQSGKRSFERRDTRKPVSTGGFGKKSTSSKPTRTSSLKPSTRPKSTTTAGQKRTSSLKPSKRPKSVPPASKRVAPKSTQTKKKSGSFSAPKRQSSTPRSSSRPRSSGSRRSGRRR